MAAYHKLRVRRPLNADERAMLDELVLDVGPRLRAYVLGAFGAAAEADDVVAETFFRAAANVEALKRCARADMYLLTIARNICRDRLRRRKPQPLADELLAARPDVSPTPAQSVEASERTRALLAAVGGLPASQREVVVLRMSAELKFEQIAELLGVPVGTVLWRMHSATKRLKRELLKLYEPEQA